MILIIEEEKSTDQGVAMMIFTIPKDIKDIYY